MDCHEKKMQWRRAEVEFKRAGADRGLQKVCRGWGVSKRQTLPKSRKLTPRISSESDADLARQPFVVTLELVQEPDFLSVSLYLPPVLRARRGASLGSNVPDPAKILFIPAELAPTIFKSAACPRGLFRGFLPCRGSLKIIDIQEDVPSQDSGV